MAETTYNTVKMDDERLVDFPGKRKLVKNSVFNADGSIQIRLDFVNGETRLFTVPDALLKQFAAHGAEQKLGDEVGGLDDVEDMVLVADKLIDRLHAGEWRAKRASDGMAGTSLLARALVEVTGKSIVDIKAFLEAKTHAEKLTLRTSPKIAPVITRLQAESGGKKAAAVNVAAMEAELGL